MMRMLKVSAWTAAVLNCLLGIVEGLAFRPGVFWMHVPPWWQLPLDKSLWLVGASGLALSLALLLRTRGKTGWSSAGVSLLPMVESMYLHHLARLDIIGG
jgi:hypothetical protein